MTPSQRILEIRIEALEEASEHARQLLVATSGLVLLLQQDGKYALYAILISLVALAAACAL